MGFLSKIGGFFQKALPIVSGIAGVIPGLGGLAKAANMVGGVVNGAMNGGGINGAIQGALSGLSGVGGTVGQIAQTGQNVMNAVQTGMAQAPAAAGQPQGAASTMQPTAQTPVM
jgi:hypothetical protein